MRVLYLTINPQTFGTTRILCNWLELGRQVSIEGSLVTLRQDTLTQWCTDQQVPWMTCPIVTPTWKNILQTHLHAMRVARFAKRQGVELIHCNEHNVYGFLRILLGYLKLPVVCHARFMLYRGFTTWAFREPFKPAALLWTTHQQMEDSADSMMDVIAPADQYIMPLGLDMDQFGKRKAERETMRKQWGCQPDDVVLGMWCALQPRKRPYDFIDVAAKLVHERPDVKAVIAAQVYPEHEAYRDEMLKYIDSLNLGDKIQWLGHVDPVEGLIHGIDIAISTSDYETFGMSVCEAMACKKPVIVYRGGSVHEVVGDAGVVLENGDTQGLYEQTARLVADPALRKRLGQEGYDRVVREYNPHDHVKRLAKIYGDILSPDKTQAQDSPV